ncbi:MAG: hypothetical protein EVJ48_01690 [Candidatus Acidulodesulfobacterium acidiphilum]|uniref:Uncharacterized protein n=1 Tax=Candidatus Acidulodesulfobacterium acidiphilum TaxID=2597224 RepID=A0A520XGB7_9DELT|nr:MAG: hypothetical protein EVJ48_01690 [Candidatus Acidulodesulfobacterium acidiphilum]
MTTNEILYDFIEDLNKSVKIGENEFTEEFESKEFTAKDGETGETIKTKVTVLEDEFIDYDDKPLYSYSFGLAGICLDEIDGYNFNDAEAADAIKDYMNKIRGYIESQKRETERRADDLNVFLGRLDKNKYGTI